MTDPLLLYDGFCPLCCGWVRFLLKVDPGGSLRFAPLSGESAAALIARHPELLAVDSLVLADGDRVLIRSAAVLGILRYLGWPWKILLAGAVIPREIRDSLYDVVAFWRHRLTGRYDACPVPPPGTSHRFLP